MAQAIIAVMLNISLKHGEQVHDALENLDASSLLKMTRDREILDRIDEEMKKLRSKKPPLEEITPMEEVEAARKNLEEVFAYFLR